GWAEQTPEGLWEAVLRTANAVTAEIGADQVGGLCLSGAMHTLLPVAADGTPLAAAMTWADTRASGLARALRKRTDPQALYERTGCPLQPIYNPARLSWWRDHGREIFNRAAYFVALKDWVLFRLTGRWATDIGLASTTGLLDIRRLAWDEEALALAGVS